MRSVGVVAVIALLQTTSVVRQPVAGTVDLHGHSRTDRTSTTLCRLVAKPGNAFTFVRPTPRSREEASVMAGGATIAVFYTGFTGAPAAQVAFEYAVGIWRNNVFSPVPMTIDAVFANLGPGLLGQASALSNVDFPGGIPNTRYGDPLADRLAGSDQFPGDLDILAEFNSTANWYFGTDGNTPPGQYDFVSVVLHELGHGLEFAGSATYSAGQGSLGGGSGVLKVYDLFTVTETGAPIRGFASPSLALGTQLTHNYNAGNPTGPGVYWGGAKGIIGNGGTRPRLYTQTPYLAGSSYSHLDESVYPAGNANSLMTYALSAAEAIHSPGPVMLGMFDDMGWSEFPDAVANGDFASGLTGWGQFADPVGTLITGVAGGVLEFHRDAPSNSGVVLRNTGMAFGAGEQMLATFSAGNSSSARKRLSVLMHDGDFSDLSVCVFWLEPFTSLQTFKMLTHTTEAWTNASISFYAASTGSNGGKYRLDNVTLRPAPAAVPAETGCFDPWSPPNTPLAPNGPQLLTNGNFSGGLAPWQAVFNITSQIVGGVFEFIRPDSTGNAGVILQPTGQALAANTIVRSSFQLGNSSAVRKRVTVLLHDLDFSDLAACTFWIPPGQALSDYSMRTYATEAWGNATLSVYAATVNTNQWTRLDNASLMTTQGAETFGTECGEPGSPVIVQPDIDETPGNYVRAADPDALRRPRPAGGVKPPASGPTGSGKASASPARGAEPARKAPAAIGKAAAPANAPPLVVTRSGVAALQISDDGIEWRTIGYLPWSDDWAKVDIELDPALGPVAFVRLVITSVR